MKSGDTENGNVPQEDDEGQTNMPTCVNCKRPFIYLHTLSIHEISCKGMLTTTVIDRDKLLLYDIISEEDIPVYASVTGNKSFHKVQITSSLPSIYIREPG